MTGLLSDPATYRWVFVIACWALVGMAWLVARGACQRERTAWAWAATWEAEARRFFAELEARNKQDAPLPDVAAHRQDHAGRWERAS